MLQTASRTLGQRILQSRPQWPTPAPAAPGHPLARLAKVTATRLRGCVSTLIAGCGEPAMLMVERVDATGRITDTWLITVVSDTVMRLEQMVADARLELLAEGPKDRILTRLVGVAKRPRATLPVMG